MMLVYTSRMIAGTRTVVQPVSHLLFSGSNRSRLCRRYAYQVHLSGAVGVVVGVGVR